MRSPNLLMMIGTRPEALKMAPVFRVIKSKTDFQLKLCVTGQHRELLEPTLRYLNMPIDWDLKLMQPNQTLSAISSACLSSVPTVLEKFEPDLVLVQGDTVSAVMTALVAFFNKIPVAHIEAGLRTGNSHSPFPEEMNRKIISCLTDLHFCPTEKSRENLLREGISPHHVFVTGNTSIDLLREEWQRGRRLPHLDSLWDSKKPVLVTIHRRENFEGGLQRIFQAIRTLAQRFTDYRFIYPVHPNPTVQREARAILGNTSGVKLISPVEYGELVYLYSRACCVMTDSGGIQEEAPSLGLTTLVLREDTERPEGLDTPHVRLVGTHTGKIIGVFEELEKRGELVPNASWTGKSPFGNGHSAEQIVETIHCWWRSTNAWSPDLKENPALSLGSEMMF